MLLCIRDNFELEPSEEDSLQDEAVAESFMEVIFQHGRLRCDKFLFETNPLLPDLCFAPHAHTSDRAVLLLTIAPSESTLRDAMLIMGRRVIELGLHFCAVRRNYWEQWLSRFKQGRLT